MWIVFGGILGFALGYRKRGLVKFGLIFLVITIVCTIGWEVFVDERIYDCTDSVPMGYLFPGVLWPGSGWPVIIFQHIVSNRPMGDPDAILQGWSVAKLWCLWSSLLVSSILASFGLAKMPWSRLK